MRGNLNRAPNDFVFHRQYEPSAMSKLRVSVVLPTRNPHPGRLRRTLDGLAAQTLQRPDWELVLVDNGSAPRVSLPEDWLAQNATLSARMIAEHAPGLTPARLAGMRESRGEIIVFADDDNVLAPAYLASVVMRFSENQRLGAAGGPVSPEFEITPPGWAREFWSLLALHHQGNAPQIAHGAIDAPWPDFAPVGAGLCVRRTAAALYIDAVGRDGARKTLDRRGASLSSGGDSDLVFTILHGGWDVAYFPELALTHLIPPSRLQPAYLARLNQGIQRSWVRVLALHGQNPWPAIPRWTVPLRSARAWLRTQAWRSPVHHIRWRGLHGRFLGQADIAGHHD
jgi:glycosyltransferase involved in cell wall biosynthesis